MKKSVLLSIAVLSIMITACRTAYPKEAPYVGLIVKAAANGDQKPALPPAAGDAAPADRQQHAEASDGTELNITGQEQNTVTERKGLSVSDQMSLLLVSGELNAMRKKIFSALDTIGSINTEKFTEAGLEIIDEIEDALAETRHYLDHEAEMIHIIPYIKDAYFDALAENRLDSIVKTREIIHLYKTNLESLYKKLGRDADDFSPEATLKQFESSIELLDKARKILEPYGKERSKLH